MDDPATTTTPAIANHGVLVTGRLQRQAFASSAGTAPVRPGVSDVISARGPPTKDDLLKIL
jgi:hypothetical protein